MEIPLCPVLQLDYKVGWKKLKEVFSMAGVVVRADILEDKDGKSRGIGTVTFEQAIEAVQAICILGSRLGMGQGTWGMHQGDSGNPIPREDIARAAKL